MDDKKLDRYLRSVGKAIFVKYYEQFDNISLDGVEIIELLKRNEGFTDNACASRVSHAKGIIKAGRGQDALNIITQSEKLDPKIILEASYLLQKYGSTSQVPLQQTSDPEKTKLEQIIPMLLNGKIEYIEEDDIPDHKAFKNSSKKYCNWLHINIPEYRKVIRMPLISADDSQPIDQHNWYHRHLNKQIKGARLLEILSRFDMMVPYGGGDRFSTHIWQEIRNHISSPDQLVFVLTETDEFYTSDYKFPFIYKSQYGEFPRIFMELHPLSVLTAIIQKPEYY